MDKKCASETCNKTLVRRKSESSTAFNMRIYCTKRCQMGKKKGGSIPKPDSNAALMDACNKFTEKCLERLEKTVTVYSRDTMSQEELRRLVSEPP